MLDRLSLGSVPDKPHLVFRSAGGGQLYEECITRAGFDGSYSMLYHLHRPHESEPIDPPPINAAVFELPQSTSERALLRRHYRCFSLPSPGGPALRGRRPLLFNQDAVVGFVRPQEADPAYFANGDADELFFVLCGGGTLRSAFGDLRFTSGDYLCVPKGVAYRLLPDSELEQAYLTLECRGGLFIPPRYRNATGQLRMDAPYSHRDFRRPTFVGPLDEGIRELSIKRRERFHFYRLEHSPLDVVGWDGSLYPFAFPILNFQPRVGMIHLPPPVHTTFEARGVAICSFVPRPLDFHPEANPCPYPHASVDVDELIFYANSAFGSRRGVAEGSLSHHPAGILHGPHPGAYENVPSPRRTEELAVMLDCSEPLCATPAALACEDPEYHASFSEKRADVR
ncbi:MAG: homogentisate 1,2-dioxygenase [Polyangiaceae bacterium]